MSEPIRLKRDQLAKVFFDHETLRQMELLLDTVDQLSNIDIVVIRSDLDAHTGDATIHFTKASIDHGGISGLADDDHTQYAKSDGSRGNFASAAQGTKADTAVQPATLSAHTGDATIHFTEASIDHGSIAGLADDDHSQYHNDSRALTWLNANRKNNILEYGFESVTVSTNVTKTITLFTGATVAQTITLPTAATAGRKVEVINGGSVNISISGSSVVATLLPGTKSEFVDTGSDWL
jgi:hypothetical protein